MSLATPWALLGLLALPLLVWLHRRARPRGDRPYSAFYLLPGAAGATARGGRLRSPLLLGLRLAAATALVVAAAGPHGESAPGTLVIAAGPLPEGAGWDEPVTVVRAGSPPTVVDEGPILPVAAEPAWGAALVLGRERAPGARVVFVAPPPTPRFQGAGAALDGERVVVEAVVRGEGTPTLEIGGERRPLERVGDGWRLVGALPPGPALVRLGDDTWPVCVPDASPLPVADAGWPPALDDVLDVLPGVRRAPAGEAVWRPGPAPAGATGWAAFAPPVTWFALGTGGEGIAPLWSDGGLPAPGAVVRRWGPLPDPGTPLLRAGDAVVVDRRSGPEGAAIRLGFDPADSDLPATAAWPVLFYDALEHDRAERARCRVHEAGAPLRLATADPVEVTAPDGRTRAFPARDGAAVVDGLDAVGLYRLRAGGRGAAVAVVPPLVPPAAEPPAALEATAAGPPPVQRALSLGLALALLVAAALVGRRRRSPAAWAALAVAAAAFAPWRLGAGDLPPVVVAVDVSGSMPPEETAAAVRRLEAALGETPRRRVAGDDRVRRAGAPDGDPPAGGGATRHGPLLAAAAALAGEGGPIILVSDGRAADGPVPSPNPVFSLPIGRAGPNAALLDVRAVRLGDDVRVAARVVADADVEATVHLGIVARRVKLRAGAPTSVAAVVPEVDVVEAAVEVAGDVAPGDDRLPAPVEGAAAGRALVVGEAALGWARAAGLSAYAVPPGALGELPLDGYRALVLHDVGAGHLDAAATARVGAWTAAGGVLVLAGRQRAFGPGGWAGTSLEALSPLAADPREPGRERVAVALLLDRSGSMATEAGGIGTEGVGALAASLAAGLEGEGDQLAVVAFGGSPEVLLPPTAVGRVRRESLPAPALARGGTLLRPAIGRALALLRSADVDARVIVVVSDGRFVDTELPETTEEILAELKAGGARLVGVLVGEQRARSPLGELAAATNGLVVEADAGAAPRIAGAGVLTAATGWLVVGGGPVAPTPAWDARVGGAAPPIDGRVRVRARPEARVLARAGGDPLLAEWSLGLGQVIALATDRWDLPAEGWRSLLAPALGPAPGDARLSVDGDRVHLVGAPGDGPPRAPLRLVGREGAVEVPWRPLAPGHAVAPLPAGPVEVLRAETATAAAPLETRIARPPAAEASAVGVDAPALAAQAALTDGAVLSGPEDVAPVLAARRPTGGWPAAPLFALAALALALGDAALWAGFRPRRRPARRPTT